MNFEKQYYENASFWDNHMLEDEANKKRIEFTTDFIPNDVNTLIDVGCGNGVFVNYLKKTKPSIKLMATDRSEMALQFVKTDKAINDIVNIDIPSNSYDCVSCLEVIEHLPNSIYKTALGELSRLSKKYVIISVPYAEDLEEAYNQCPSCKTIFNRDLHLRNFKENDMEILLDDFGYKCVKINLLGESKHYKGHFTFRKIFYKNQFRQWQSPICPICGYEESAEKESNYFHKIATNTKQQISLKQKIVSTVGFLPKLLWPKVTKHYWIIGLYEKNIS
jgi:SAM-dependent methyltransferase